MLEAIQFYGILNVSKIKIHYNLCFCRISMQFEGYFLPTFIARTISE